MGDISMDEYGCVAISPLWLGGTEQQNSLFCVHNCPEVGAPSTPQGKRRLGSAAARLAWHARCGPSWRLAALRCAAP